MSSKIKSLHGFLCLDICAGNRFASARIEADAIFLHDSSFAKAMRIDSDKEAHPIHTIGKSLKWQ